MDSFQEKAISRAQLVRIRFPASFSVLMTKFTDARLLEITHLLLNPPRVPTPVHEEPVEEPKEVSASLDSIVDSESDVAVAGVPEVIPTSGSFHFMQASELETPSFEDSAEWVERADATAHEEVDRSAPQEEIVETVIEAGINGHGLVEESVAVVLPTETEVGDALQRQNLVDLNTFHV